jgi:hypothetical protein
VKERRENRDLKKRMRVHEVNKKDLDLNEDKNKSHHFARLVVFLVLVLHRRHGLACPFSSTRTTRRRWNAADPLVKTGNIAAGVVLRDGEKQIE